MSTWLRELSMLGGMACLLRILLISLQPLWPFPHPSLQLDIGSHEALVIFMIGFLHQKEMALGDGGHRILQEALSPLYLCCLLLFCSSNIGNVELLAWSCEERIGTWFGGNATGRCSPNTHEACRGQTKTPWPRSSSAYPHCCTSGLVERRSGPEPLWSWLRWQPGHGPQPWTKNQPWFAFGREPSPLKPRFIGEKNRHGCRMAGARFFPSRFFGLWVWLVCSRHLLLVFFGCWWLSLYFKTKVFWSATLWTAIGDDGCLGPCSAWSWWKLVVRGLLWCASFPTPHHAEKLFSREHPPGPNKNFPNLSIPPNLCLQTCSNHTKHNTKLMTTWNPNPPGLKSHHPTHCICHKKRGFSSLSQLSLETSHQPIQPSIHVLETRPSQHITQPKKPWAQPLSNPTWLTFCKPKLKKGR